MGKALYGVFNGLNDIFNQVDEIRHENIYGIFLRYSRSAEMKRSIDYRKKYDELICYIIKNRNQFISNKKSLNYYIMKNKNVIIDEENQIHDTLLERSSYYSSKNIDDEIESITEEIFESLKISTELIIKRIVQRSLDSEFRGDIKNKYKTAEETSVINLTIKDEIVKVEILKDEVSKVKNVMSMTKEIVYIDDPYVIDDLNKVMRSGFFLNFEGKNHRDTLKEKLLRDSKDLLETIKTDEKLKDIYTKLEYIKLGELKYRNNIARYEADDLSINAENIAAGLKTFVIIKTLLENGSLENDGTMILDEPEIHLHPKWQLLLAELIVLIQKVFNMHILLNTHSPYFLHAIEVYSKHHGISKKCRYYLTELDEEEKTAHIKEVTGNTEEIYKLLAEPFDTLELI